MPQAGIESESDYEGRRGVPQTLKGMGTTVPRLERIDRLKKAKGVD